MISPPVRPAGRVPGRARCRPRRPTGRWSPPRPSSRPSHRGRSKPRASCSCLKVARHRKAHALAPWGVTVKGRKRGMQPHLVHENQPRGMDLRSHHRPPGGPQELVSLSGAWPPFLRVEPILAMARHMVERLTETPLMASTYSQRSLRAWRTGAPLGPLRGACRLARPSWAVSQEPCRVLGALPSGPW
jgi:hypothetical protein